MLVCISAYSRRDPKKISPLPSRCVSSYFCEFAGRRNSGGVREGFSQVWEGSDRIAKIVLAIVFGIGMWLTYSLFRLRFPDIEEQRLDSEVMGSFAYQTNSTKRWMVWVLSAVGGIVNVGLLALVAMALSS